MSTKVECVHSKHMGNERFHSLVTGSDMHIYVSAVSLCQRCGRALLYDVGLRVSCEFSVDSSSSADSTAVGDFAFTMTQSHDYPQKALASYHIDLCIDQLKCSPEMTTGFSQLQCLLALL